MNVSHATWLALFSPIHQKKPRLMALASAILSQAADLLSLIQSFPEVLSLDSAEGAQLDALGVLLNIPRPTASTSDADYRFLLHAKIAAFHWNGTNETLPAVLAAAFPGRDATLLDNQDGTVTATLPGGAPLPLEEIFPVPAGVGIVE